jgi:hypothetical protein
VLTLSADRKPGGLRRRMTTTSQREMDFIEGNSTLNLREDQKTEDVYAVRSRSRLYWVGGVSGLPP